MDVTKAGSGRVSATTPAHGRLRVLRGLALASATLVIPAVAHVIAGGAVPVDFPAMLAAGGLAGACVALADRRRGLLEIGAVVLLSQPIMHAVLSWGGHHDATVGGFGMLIAHVIAGAIVSAMLAGAEDVLWVWWALRRTVLWPRARWDDLRLLLILATQGVRRRRRGAVRRSGDAVAPEHCVVMTVAPRRGPPRLRVA